MVICNDVMLLGTVKTQLMETFKMKDLGPIHWFLGLEIICDRLHHLITISQGQYVTDVVRHFGFSDSHPISMPIAINLKLPIPNTLEIDVQDYQSQIGSIMYAMLGTQPNITYAIGMLSQYSANPGASHLTAVNQLLQY